MSPYRHYLSVLLFVTILGTARTATTTNRVTKKEKNASSSSSSSTTVSLLAFQPARECAIRKETSARGLTTRYHFLGTVGLKATIFFSDRPARVAKNVFTRAFVENFDAMFVSSKPNTVLSLAQEENNPLIVVITAARITSTNEEDGSLVVEYAIEQRGSQSAVSSIEAFVGLDRQECSIFVDDFNPNANYNPYESNYDPDDPSTNPYEAFPRCPHLFYDD